jgi:Flp pilus assembly protein TadD
VIARTAAGDGALERASASFAEALAAAPTNRAVAENALGHSLVAGDRALALRAATVLAGLGDTSPEVRLMLLGEALRTNEWRSANAQVDELAKDEVFAFMAPVMRAWIAHGARRGDPFELLDSADTDPLARAFVGESRALLSVARDRRGGAALLAQVADSSGIRGQRLRIAGAALLARRGDRGEALALLEGPGDALAQARQMVQQRRRIPGEISTAGAGIGEFLARLSVDLNAQEVRPLALAFARIATFLDPENSEAALIVAELLLEGQRHDAALAALRQVRSDDPFATTARDHRARLLLDSGRREAALDEARAASEREGAGLADWTRLGDLHLQLGRPAEAAAAYVRAIALAGDGGDPPLWQLHLAHAAALEQAGDWPAAKAALESAYRIAPTEPQVLNDLGYLQLERRENIAEATRLVAEAHRLAPESPAITDSLGWAHYLAGDLPRAIELLESAAQRAPADIEINEHLGDAYYRAGRRIEARFAWKAALVYAADEDAQRIRTKIDSGLAPVLAAR